MKPRQKLWQHLHDEHGLLLFGSELEEIIMLAKEIIESDLITERPESGFDARAAIACILLLGC